MARSRTVAPLRVVLAVLALVALAACSSTSHSSSGSTLPTLYPTTVPGLDADSACGLFQFSISTEWQDVATGQQGAQKLLDLDLARLPQVITAFRQMPASEPEYGPMADQAAAFATDVQQHRSTEAAALLKKLTDECWNAPIHITHTP